MDWNQQKVVDLRTELKRRGLPHSGLKADLIARLKTSDAEKLQTNGSPKCEAEAESQPEPTSATANPTTSNSPKEPPDVDVERLQAINPPETVESESQSAILQEAKHVAAPELALTDHLNDPGTSITTDPPQQQADVKQADAERSTEQTSPTLHAETIDEPDSAARQIDVEVSLPTDNLDSSMRDLPPPEKVDREPTTESLQQDSQKRKRRSITPPPSPTLSANKRQKTSLEVGKPPPEAAASSNMVIDNTEENLLSRFSHAVSSGLADSLPPAQDAFTKQSTSRHEVSLTSHIPSNMVLEREVVPSLHPATEALYIRNFMRPLRALDVKSYLASLATALEATEPEDIIDFHLDHIRTHAFVLFSNISAASRVRTALHDKVWPEEVNRKPLWVDFIPAEKVREWIDEEESSRASSSTTNHFVVLYEDDGFGSVTPRLASSSSAAAKGAPTSGPSGGRGPPTPTTMMPPPKEPRIVNAVPTGPRSLRRFGVDFQQQALDGSGLDIPPPRGPAHKEAGGEVKYTTARPGVSWQPVSPELAQARLQDMRSYYTKEVDRDMGPESEINRYTFEGKYRFVDRGREIPGMVVGATEMPGEDTEVVVADLAGVPSDDVGVEAGTCKSTAIIRVTTTIPETTVHAMMITDTAIPMTIDVGRITPPFGTTMSEDEIGTTSNIPIAAKAGATTMTSTVIAAEAAARDPIDTTTNTIVAAAVEGTATFAHRPHRSPIPDERHRNRSRGHDGHRSHKVV